ncbi:aminotransferase class V-fold PLP-dependent enzyme [Candidatus Hodgkinia cicadicola]
MHSTLWLRSWFSILTCYSKPITYFDNASTTQRHALVLDVFLFANFRVCANLARGKYFLSNELGRQHALARARVLSSLRADESYECIVYKSATEALNCVCFGSKLSPNFRAIMCVTEHHSGLVPWLVAERIFGVRINTIGLDCDHIPSVRQYLNLARIANLVLISHMSNLLGALVPIGLYINISNGLGFTSVIDGAQAASHFDLDLARWACTEYVLTAHKLYGSAGASVAVGTRALFNRLVPVVFGGGGVRMVSLSPRTYALAGLPYKHEAGSPMSFGLISLSLLIVWRHKLDSNHECHLLRYLWAHLVCLSKVCLLNKCFPSTRILSFEFERMQADDVSAFLNKLFVCIRSGAHCAMPLLAYFGKKSVCRVSLALYNTYKDADALCFGLAYLDAVA